MIYGIKTVVKYILGTDRAERDFAVYPDDTFVVSYPRSGNTWTRFLIANLVYPEKNVGFTNIEKLIPDTSSQSNRALKSTPRPRIIKTHEYFDHRYRKVIYIVRDPRDVVQVVIRARGDEKGRARGQMLRRSRDHTFSLVRRERCTLRGKPEQCHACRAPRHNPIDLSHMRIEIERARFAEVAVEDRNDAADHRVSS